MRASRLDITTPDGVADAYLSRPDDEARHPGVLLIMDAFGLRADAQNADQIIARVNGTDIRASDVAIAEEDIGSNLSQIPPESRREYLTSYLTDMTLVAKAAEGRKLADADEFKQRLAYYRTVITRPEGAYFGSVVLALLGLLALVVWLAGASGWWAPLVLLAALLPASELAVGLVNYGFNLFLPPRVLPKLEFKDGQWYRLRIRVSKKRIEAWIDKDKVVDLDTTDRRITIRIECQASKPFGIATYETVGAVRNIRVRPLTDADKKEIAETKPEKKE